MNYINQNFYKSDISGQIIKCAQKVHRTLGNGFQEVIYQRALSHEMELRNIPHQREVEMDVMYKEIQVGRRRVDFLVDETISVEIKALTQLEPVHLAQAINYLEAYNLEIGLLINFGETKLKFHRLENKKYKKQS